MPQREIEVILTRQLASYLTLPIFIVDPAGTLVFYNEPAEVVPGRRLDETGAVPAHARASAYTTADPSGTSIPHEQLPLMVALRERRPAHGRLLINGLDHVRRL